MHDIKTVIDQLKYHEHNWTICANLKMVNFLLGQQRGITKCSCFICIWDSKIQSSVEKKIIFFPLHVNLGGIKQLVRALYTDGKWFQCVVSVLSALAFEKIKTVTFDGSQIRTLVRDPKLCQKDE